MAGHFRVLNNEDKEFISPWNYGVGVILMDYCYIGNKFMNIILNEIYEGTWKNKPIAWVCDYDMSAKYGTCWGDSVEVQICATTISQLNFSEVCIINNDKKEFVDLTQYKLEWNITRENITHPFPILTNASIDFQGDGDYDFEHPNRGRWEGDRFTVVFDRADVPYDYLNITSDSLFYTSTQFDIAKDEFKRKSLLLSKDIDLETRDRLISDPQDKAFRRDSFFNGAVDYSPNPPKFNP